MAVPTAHSPQIFISYAREDIAAASSVYDHLKSRGFRPFMDKRDLVGGEQWETALVRAVRASDFFVFCASPRSVNKRGMIQRELKVAFEVWNEKLEDDIFLIPLRLEPCELPEKIRAFHWVDLFEPNGFARLDRAISEGLARLHGHDPATELRVIERVIDDKREGQYFISVHYPELQPAYAADIAAINTTISSWTNKIAARLRKHSSSISIEERPQLRDMPDSLDVSYSFEHLGTELISLRFLQGIYFRGAAHPNANTLTFNFRRHPFVQLELDDVLDDDESLSVLSEFCVADVLRQQKERGDGLDPKWVTEGAAPDYGNFSRFLLSPGGVESSSTRITSVLTPRESTRC